MTIKELCLLVFLLWAAYVDGKEYRIPNMLILSALLCRGVLYLFADGFPFGVTFPPSDNVLLKNWFSEWIAASIVVLIALVIRKYRSDSIGAGDFKLLFVMALFLGLEAFFLSLVYSSAIAFIVIAYLFLFKKIKKNHAIPLAPILASGVVVFFIFQT